MALQHIESLEDSRVQSFRDLKKTNRTRWSGEFIAEGRKVVERLLESSLEVRSVLVSERQLHYLPDSPRLDTLNVYVLRDELACELVGYNFHAGILGCGIRPANAELAQLCAKSSGLIVACERLTDPDNLGTIVRLATGFGALGLLLSPGCCDPYSRRTLRVSMGNLLSLSLRESPDFQQELQLLAKWGWASVATVLDATATPLRQFAGPQKGVVLLGNEADGLSLEVVQQCEHRVTIPMQGTTDSLNVALAAGIVLYELTADATAE